MEKKSSIFMLCNALSRAADITKVRPSLALDRTGPCCGNAHSLRHYPTHIALSFSGEN
jgi:hypothetical protein